MEFLNQTLTNPRQAFCTPGITGFGRRAAMQKGFVKQLQEAAEAGQVVLIPTPAKPAPRTSATPPPRHRDEVSLAATLCLMFKLRRSEGQVLMKMATQDFVSKDEIFTAAA